MPQAHAHPPFPFPLSVDIRILNSIRRPSNNITTKQSSMSEQRLKKTIERKPFKDSTGGGNRSSPKKQQRCRQTPLNAQINRNKQNKKTPVSEDRVQKNEALRSSFQKRRSSLEINATRRTLLPGRDFFSERFPQTTRMSRSSFYYLSSGGTSFPGPTPSCSSQAGRNQSCPVFNGRRQCLRAGPQQRESCACHANGGGSEV